MADIEATGTPARKAPAIAVPPQGIDGYDQCWYPVAWSHELKPQAVLSREFMNGRVAVFRGDDGLAQVLSAYCSHMGADLSTGAVVGNELRCPFHHWTYDKRGKCASVTGGAAIPPHARVFSFPTSEAHGLIWAFNGPQPTYEVPHWPQYLGEQLLVEADAIFDVRNDPFVLCANSVDFQHLRYLHELPFPFKVADFDVRPGAYFGFYQRGAFMGDEIESKITVWGTNVFTTSAKSKSGRQQLVMMAANCPLPGNRSRTFSVIGTPLQGTEAETREHFAATREQMKFMTDKLLREDGANMETIHFRVDNLSSVDGEIGRFFRYALDFPRYATAMDYLV